MGGVDSWNIQTSAEADTKAGFSEESSNLLLPNAFTTWRYRDTAAFGLAAGSIHLGDNTLFMFQARVDQTMGERVDEASLEYKFSPSFGLRAGVTNYKTSWCRHYDRDNGWIRDAETLCVTPQFKDVTGGGPGIQMFSNSHIGHNHVLQSQVGIYSPLLLGYAPDEFSNAIPSADFHVTKNRKLGLNLNWLNMQSGTEMRLSYMHNNQAGRQQETDLLGQVEQRGHLVYWGLSTPLTPVLNLRVTQMLSQDKMDCWSTLEVTLYRCNLKNTVRKLLTSVQLSYQWDASNLISVGVNQSRLQQDALFFNVKRELDTIPAPFFIDARQFTIAWRKDWGSGWITVAQAMWARQKNGYPALEVPQIRAETSGRAFGARLAYQY